MYLVINLIIMKYQLHFLILIEMLYVFQKSNLIIIISTSFINILIILSLLYYVNILKYLAFEFIINFSYPVLINNYLQIIFISILFLNIVLILALD